MCKTLIPALISMALIAGCDKDLRSADDPSRTTKTQLPDGCTLYVYNPGPAQYDVKFVRCPNAQSLTTETRVSSGKSSRAVSVKTN